MCSRMRGLASTHPVVRRHAGPNTTCKAIPPVTQPPPPKSLHKRKTRLYHAGVASIGQSHLVLSLLHGSLLLLGMLAGRQQASRYLHALQVSPAVHRQSVIELGCSCVYAFCLGSDPGPEIHAECCLCGGYRPVMSPDGPWIEGGQTQRLAAEWDARPCTLALRSFATVGFIYVPLLACIILHRV